MSVQTLKGILQTGHPTPQMTEVQLKSHFNQSVWKKIFTGGNNQAVKPPIQSKILPMLGTFGLVKPVKQAIKMLWLTWIYITGPKIPRSQCKPQFVYLSTQWQKTRGRQKYFLQL